MRVIPVLGNILIKSLPLLDADGEEMDASIQTHRKGEITAIGEAVEIPVKVWDIVLLNRANFFLPIGEEILVHSSAIFAIEEQE